MKNTRYVSEVTQFLQGLLAKPEIKTNQQQTRATWWDKGFIDLEEQQSFQASAIKPEGYVYFSYPQPCQKP